MNQNEDYLAYKRGEVKPSVQDQLVQQTAALQQEVANLRREVAEARREARRANQVSITYADANRGIRRLA